MQCSCLFLISLINNTVKSNLGVGWFHLTGYSSSSREAKIGTQGKSMKQKNMGEYCLLAWLLLCFFIQAKFTVPRICLSTVDRILPYQLVASKISHRQGLQVNLLEAILQFKFPLYRCVKETTEMSHHKQSHNHSESEFLQLVFVWLTSLTSCWRIKWENAEVCSTKTRIKFHGFKSWLVCLQTE